MSTSAAKPEVPPVSEPEWPCDPVESVFAKTRRGLLTEDEWHGAIEQIMRSTDQELEARFEGRRRDGGERYFRQAPCMLRVEAADGSLGVHLVTTRNLSRGGVSVLHGDQIGVGSACMLAMQTPSGPGVLVNAVVEWCREVTSGDQGGSEAYEIGLRFQTPLDVTPFLEPRGDEPA